MTMLNTIKEIDALMRAKLNYDEAKEKMRLMLTEEDQNDQRLEIARAASIMGAKVHRVINQFFEDYAALLSSDTDSFAEIYSQPQGTPVYGPIKCTADGKESAIVRFMDCDPGCPPGNPWTPCVAVIDENKRSGVSYPLMKTIDTLVFKDGTVFERRKKSEDLDRTGMFSKLFGKKKAGGENSGSTEMCAGTGKAPV